MKPKLSTDALSGLLLIAATAVALILDNSSAAPLYDALLNVEASIKVGDYGFAKPILLWVNEGLMAVFFMLVGLEIKREMVDGSLSNAKSLALPGLAAVGGMAVPALLFWLGVGGDTTAMQGWAIPTATDIAFAIGLLALLSNRVPAELKLFLLTLAILDDLGAVLIIAIFYTADLSTISLSLGLLGCVMLFLMNRFGVRNLTAYLFVGIIIWGFVVKSGVHATLAGVAVGLAVPATRNAKGKSPLSQLEHSLHTPVSLMILPLFALVNAGVSLSGVTLASLAEPISLGIILGLVIGKPIGALAGAWAATALFNSKLPTSVTFRHIWGAGHLAGIGFTMSLFIGSLAYTSIELQSDVRIGVLAASLISGLAGWVILSGARKVPDITKKPE